MLLSGKPQRVSQTQLHKTNVNIPNIIWYLYFRKEIIQTTYFLWKKKVSVTSAAVSHRANQYTLTWKSVRWVDYAYFVFFVFLVGWFCNFFVYFISHGKVCEWILHIFIFCTFGWMVLNNSVLHTLSHMKKCQVNVFCLLLVFCIFGWVRFGQVVLNHFVANIFGVRFW